MKNIDSIKDRYLKEPVNMRLGHLASDIARISSFLENSDNMQAVNDIIEESKFFIEWTTLETSEDCQFSLVEMQTELALSQRRLQLQSLTYRGIKELKEKASNWSAQLLEISGLTKS